MAKKKSSFYHTRWNKVGINEMVAADLLGVSVEQILEWDNEGAPPIVEAYLLLWDNKRINIDGWDGFYFSRGALRYKRQFSLRPELLLKNYDYSRENFALQREIAAFKTWRGVYGLFVLVLRTSIERFVYRVKRF